MTFLELAQRRYSVRNYASQEVEEEKLNYVLQCARLAPSAVNRQPWRLYIVRSKETKEAICRSYPRPWMTGAPVCIVVCADDATAWVRSSDGKSHADIDAAILTEHICLAAAEQGLGTCWVCNFDVDLCRQALSLPEHLHPVALIPLGYPADVEPRKSERKKLEDICEMR
ncbi:MAG: nitroreductase family protein [Bacteroidales bacterium]|nr:nitroreductase family protein [Bacteroidales bacterium]